MSVVQKFVLSMLAQTSVRSRNKNRFYTKMFWVKFLVLQFYNGFGFSSVIDNGKTQVLHRGHYKAWNLRDFHNRSFIHLIQIFSSSEIVQSKPNFLKYLHCTFTKLILSQLPLFVSYWPSLAALVIIYSAVDSE